MNYAIASFSALKLFQNEPIIWIVECFWKRCLYRKAFLTFCVSHDNNNNWKIANLAFEPYRKLCHELDFTIDRTSSQYARLFIVSIILFLSAIQMETLDFLIWCKLNQKSPSNSTLYTVNISHCLNNFNSVALLLLWIQWYQFRKQCRKREQHP